MLKDLRAYGLVAAGIVCGLVWGGGCNNSSSSSGRLIACTWEGTDTTSSSYKGDMQRHSHEILLAMELENANDANQP